MCPSTSPLASRILYRSAGCGKMASRRIPVRALACGANFREHRFSRWPFMTAPPAGIVGYLDGAHIEFLSGRPSRHFSSNSLACSTWRDLKLRRESRSSSTAARIAYSVERGIASTAGVRSLFCLRLIFQNHHVPRVTDNVGDVLRIGVANFCKFLLCLAACSSLNSVDVPPIFPVCPSRHSGGDCRDVLFLDADECPCQFHFGLLARRFPLPCRARVAGGVSLNHHGS